jgi:hypothetical protein
MRSDVFAQLILKNRLPANTFRGYAATGSHKESESFMKTITIKNQGETSNFAFVALKFGA